MQWLTTEYSVLQQLPIAYTQPENWSAGAATCRLPCHVEGCKAHADTSPSLIAIRMVTFFPSSHVLNTRATKHQEKSEPGVQKELTPNQHKKKVHQSAVFSSACTCQALSLPWRTGSCDVCSRTALLPVTPQTESRPPDNFAAADPVSRLKDSWSLKANFLLPVSSYIPYFKWLKKRKNQGKRKTPKLRKIKMRHTGSPPKPISKNSTAHYPRFSPSCPR